MNTYTELSDRIYHRTSSDLNNKSIVDPLWLSQGNAITSVVAITLYNNGVKLSDDILSNSTVNFRCRINGEDYAKSALGYSNGTVYFETDSTMTSVSGYHDAQIELRVIHDGSIYGRVSTYPFKMYVSPNVVTGVDVQTSAREIIEGSVVDAKISRVNKLKSHIFFKCTSLKSIVIKRCVSVEDNVFNGCSSLEYLDLGYTISQLGVSAFNQCPKLSTIIIRNAEEVVQCNEIYDPFEYNPPDSFVYKNVYVPDEIYPEYQNNEYWRQLIDDPLYKVNVKPLSELEDD